MAQATHTSRLTRESHMEAIKQAILARKGAILLAVTVASVTIVLMSL